MTETVNTLPQRLLRTQEAARYLGLSGRTLEKHRTYGTGPRYAKIGGRVVYALSDLQAWVGRGVRACTADISLDPVLPAKRHAALRRH
jgi:predicted DNA-binding transcriptional regulator AlpA